VDRRLLSGRSAAVDALVVSKTADVMVKITGAVPRQSVPDPVVRAANEVEVVGLAPEVWRRAEQHLGSR